MKERLMNDETENKLQNEVEILAAKLRFPLVMGSDFNQKVWKKGPQITIGQLKAVPTGAIMWVTWQPNGYQMESGPYRVTHTKDGVTLDNGSSFGHDFSYEDHLDTDICIDDKCGEGEFHVYQAISAV